MYKQINNMAKSALAKANKLSNTDVGNLQSQIDSNNTDITDLKNRLTALENRLANYENHTHTYEDDTISDTSDGSGVTTTATKHTSGVD